MARSVPAFTVSCVSVRLFNIHFADIRSFLHDIDSFRGVFDAQPLYGVPFGLGVAIGLDAVDGLDSSLIDLYIVDCCLARLAAEESPAETDVFACVLVKREVNQSVAHFFQVGHVHPV